MSVICDCNGKSERTSEGRSFFREFFSLPFQSVELEVLALKCATVNLYDTV